MKRIYLSGPMTGRPNLNFPAFYAAAARLRALGYDVVSPAEIVPGTKATWHDAMRTDIKDLLDCDTLALLDGWQESAGAHLEMHVAHRVGIKIVVEAEIVEVCSAGPIYDYVLDDLRSHKAKQPADDPRFISGTGTAASVEPVAEELVRFCPGCGSVGHTPDEFHDCCPDGDKARFIPKPLAEHCHELFVLALKGAAEPSAEPASEQLDCQEAQKRTGKGQSICIEVLADTSTFHRQIAILSAAACRMDALAKLAQLDCSVLSGSDPAPQSSAAPQTDPVADLISEVERLRAVIRRAAAAFEMGCDARETYDRLRTALSGKEAQS